MNFEEKINFSQFGKTFQENLVQIILEDRPFSEQIEEVLDVNFFEPHYLRVFVRLLYDYKSKYTKGMTKYIIPAKIPKNIERKCKKYTEKIHKFLKCKGITRTDFRFDEKKTFGKELYVLEINTQPGMTPLSLVPMMAKYKGISFDKLIEKIINNN